MTLDVLGYTFDGPYASAHDLEDRSGVYLIVDSTNRSYQPVDYGESPTVKTRVSTHDRADCWQRNCSGKPMVAVHYTPGQQQAGRRAIESKICAEFDFPCEQILGPVNEMGRGEDFRYSPAPLTKRDTTGVYTRGQR